jgi:2-polyprenyl-3-methyl-5-hydroxy-6-metoxy-1,4-benzoquinol methylase
MMYYRVDLQEEQAQVERAAAYYQQWAADVQATDSESLRRYYRGMLAPAGSAALRFRALFFAMRLQPVLTYIQRAPEPPHILDLGCGYGLESTLLSQAGARVWAIDTASEKIAEARRQQSGKSLDLRYDTASLFDFHPDVQFDAVYSSATLHHIEPVGQAIQVIADLLKPGGWFFLSDENGYSPVQQLAVQRRIGWTSPRYVTRTDPTTGLTQPYGHENIRAPFQWSGHMRRAGLQPRFIKYCRQLPPLNWPLEQLVRSERLLRQIPGVAQLVSIGFLLAAQK